QTGEAPRKLAEIEYLLQEISYRISDPEDLPAAIARCLQYPHEKEAGRRKANRMMFDELDGNAGRRAAEIIKAYIPVLSSSGVENQER
ncbi:MAG: hypothetical protein WAN36_04855, partial [Calditrichia bacterium]